MSIKTAKKEKDKLYAELRNIKKVLHKNEDSIQDLRTSVILNNSNENMKNSMHEDSIKLYAQNLAYIKANGELEARHSFIIGTMVGAMGVMILLILISVFA